MSGTNRTELRLRVRASTNTALGKVIKYLQVSHHDPQREVERLLEARFLPYALKLEAADGKMSRLAAYDCIGQLEGMIRSIREAYQLAHPEPSIGVSPMRVAAASAVMAAAEEEEVTMPVPPDPEEEMIDEQMDIARNMFGGQ